MGGVFDIGKHFLIAVGFVGRGKNNAAQAPVFYVAGLSEQTCCFKNIPGPFDIRFECVDWITAGDAD